MLMSTMAGQAEYRGSKAVKPNDLLMCNKNPLDMFLGCTWELSKICAGISKVSVKLHKISQT